MGSELPGRTTPYYIDTRPHTKAALIKIIELRAHGTFAQFIYVSTRMCSRSAGPQVEVISVLLNNTDDISWRTHSTLLLNISHARLWDLTFNFGQMRSRLFANVHTLSQLQLVVWDLQKWGSFSSLWNPGKDIERTVPH